MSGKKQINLVVSSKQKKRWAEFQDSHPEFATMSDLIRTAVEDYIRTSDEDNTGQEGAFEDDFLELQEHLDQIELEIENLQTRQIGFDNEQFALRVFDSLKPLPEAPEDQDSTAIHTVAFDNEPQTAHSIAERLDSTPRRVSEAIEYLKEHHFPIVQYEMPDGELHFFKEE